MPTPNAINSSQPLATSLRNPFRPFLQPNSQVALPSPPHQDDTLKQLESLSQKLDTAEKKILEYAQLIASLYAEVKRYQDIICHGCRQKISLATASPPTGFTQSTSKAVFAASTLSEPVDPPGPGFQSTIEPFPTASSLGSLDQSVTSRLACVHPPGPFVNTDLHSEIVATDSPQRTVGKFPNTIADAVSPESAASDWSVEYNPEIRQSLHLRVANTFSFKDWVLWVTFSPDGKYFAAGLWNGETHVYNMMTGFRSVLVKRSATGFNSDTAEDDPYQIRAVRFSLDNNYLATAGGLNGRINIWEIGRKRVRATFKAEYVTSLDWSPDGRLLVSASYGSVSLWNRRDGSRRKLSGGFTYFMSVAFNPDGRLVAAGSSTGVLWIWDTRTGQLVAKCNTGDTKDGTIVDLKVVFTPDGNGIVTGAYTLQYWDLSSLKDLRHSRQHTGMLKDSPNQLNQIFEFHRNKQSINAISLISDNRWVVSSFGHDACLLDARTGAWVCTLKGHVQNIRTVAFSPAGRYMASGGGDKRVRLWTYEMLE